jgi:hypothetical protein
MSIVSVSPLGRALRLQAKMFPEWYLDKQRGHDLFNLALRIRRSLRGYTCPTELCTELEGPAARRETATGSVQSEPGSFIPIPPPPRLTEPIAETVSRELPISHDPELKADHLIRSPRKVALKHAALGTAGFGTAMVAGSFLVCRTSGREIAQLSLFSSLILTGLLGPLALNLGRPLKIGVGSAFLLLAIALNLMDLHHLETEQASILFVPELCTP